MGKKKRVPNTRKKTLQLSSETKKSEGDLIGGKGAYAQVPAPHPTGNDNGVELQMNQGINARIADFMMEIHSLGSLDETEEASHTTHHVTENDTENREKEEEEKMDEERGHFRGEDSVTTDAPITMGPTVQPSFWQQVMDPNTNHPYYWNPSTNEVLWSLPEGGVITGGGVGGLGEREDEEYFDFYKESDSSGDHSKVRSGRGGGGGRGGERKSDAGNVSSKENIAVAVVESAATTGKGKSNIPFRADSESTSATNPASQPKGTEKVESEAGGRGGGGEQKPLQDEEEMDFVGPLPAIGKASVGEGRREEGDQEEGERGILTVTQTPPSRLKRKAEERDEQEQGEEDEVVFSHLEHTYSVQAGFHADHGSVSPPKKMAHSARSFGRAPEEKLSRKSYGTSQQCLSSKQAEQALRFQVSSLADELTRKLQYLHVSSDGISDVQLLQIELKTRLNDWKEGGLPSKFLLDKLKQASHCLHTYEEQSAPHGWKYVWDSTTCRYQFLQLFTGVTTFDYPSSIPQDSEDHMRSGQLSSQEAREEGEEEEEEDGEVEVEQEQGEREEEEDEDESKEDEEEEEEEEKENDVVEVIQENNANTSQSSKVTSAVSHAPTTIETTASANRSSAVPKPAKVVLHINKQPTPGTRLAPPPPPPPSTSLPSTPPSSSPLSSQPSDTLTSSKKKGNKHTSQLKSTVFSDDIPVRAHAQLPATDTPTADYLRGSEMAPAPLPRAWKYENDELNRRVKRDGSIERREDVTEKELSIEDVRSKLQKREAFSKTSQAKPKVPSPKVSSELMELSDTELFAHFATYSEEPMPKYPESDDECLTKERSDFPLSSNRKDVAIEQESRRKIRSSSDLKYDEEDVVQHSSKSYKASSVGGSGDNMEEEARDKEREEKREEEEEEEEEEGGLLAVASPSPTAEESEAQLRERLIQKTKRIRMSQGPNTTSGEGRGRDRASEPLSPGEKKIEASTGMLYQSQREEKGGVEYVAKATTEGGHSLIRSGFGEIHVSYDRVEPETGETENIAMGRGGRGGVDRALGGEHVSVTVSDTIYGLSSAAKETGGMESGPSLQPLTSDTQPLTPISDAPLDGQSDSTEQQCDIELEEERELYAMGEEEKQGKRRRSWKEYRGSEKEEAGDSESPISGSSWRKKVVTPSRCYMDEERERNKERRNERHHYDSDHSEHSDRNDRGRKSHKTYSRSRSRSWSDDRKHSKSLRYHRSRGESDHSDYDYHYSGDEKERERRRPKKRHHRRDDYSDHSLSSDDYHSYSRKKDYGSERHRRDYSGDCSRYSRSDDTRLSHSHHHRSRSHSKESRELGKKDRDKKKHKEKKEKRRKKERNKEKGDVEGGVMKPAASVMVGRVGKVSSIRTLGQKRMGDTEGGGEGSGRDTLLDRAQAAIAESIEVKQKQEREEQSRKEEKQQLENRIQQQMAQQGRSAPHPSQPVQPVVMYPAYQQTGQGDYYGSLYAGYQQYSYPQRWAGQWGGTEQGQQYGMGAAAGVGTDTQTYTGVGMRSEAGQYGPVEHRGWEGSTAAAGSGEAEQTPHAPDLSKKMVEQEKQEKFGSEESNEQFESARPTLEDEGQLHQKEGEETVGVNEEEVKEAEEEVGEEDGKSGELKEKEKAADDVEGKEDRNAESEMEIECGSRMDYPNTSEAVTNASPVTTNTPEMDGKSHNVSVGSVVVITEKQQVPITPTSYPSLNPQPLADSEVIHPTCISSPVSPATEQDSPLPPPAASEEVATLSETEAVKDSPGIEKTFVETSPSALENPPRKRLKRWDIVEEIPLTTQAQPLEVTDSSTSTVTPSTEQPSVKGAEITPPPPGTEKEEPSASKIELEQPLHAESSDVSDTAMDVSSLSPSPSPPHTEISMPASDTLAPVPEISLPKEGEEEEIGGIEEAEAAVPSVPLPIEAPTISIDTKQCSSSPHSPTVTSSENPSVTSQPSDTSTHPTPTLVATITPLPIVSGTATTTYENQPSYYNQPISQEYNYAAAAAAYSQTANTGQQYQYGPYSGGYDYAAYNAYLQQQQQQMAQSGGSYGGYAVGPDGQYYYQQNPYSAYGGYGGGSGYYASGGGVPTYNYGSQIAPYQTGAQSQTSTQSYPSHIPTTTPTSADGAEAAKNEKKGDFTLSGNREKQLKNLMDKWTTFKDK